MTQRRTRTPPEPASAPFEIDHTNVPLIETALIYKLEVLQSDDYPRFPYDGGSELSVGTLLDRITTAHVDVASTAVESPLPPIDVEFTPTELACLVVGFVPLIEDADGALETRYETLAEDLLHAAPASWQTDPDNIVHALLAERNLDPVAVDTEK